MTDSLSSSRAGKELFMTEEQFGLLREIVADEFGIAIKGDKRLTIHAKIAHRLSILGIKSYNDYCSYIVSEPDKGEMFRLMAHITNNETYFFREKTHLKVFSDLLGDVKRNRQKAKQNKVRILSAGCSTGEEAYTLNILLMESGLFAWGWDVNVMGMDASGSAIKKAEAGEYSKSSFRMMNGTEDAVRKYFDRGGESYVLKRPYRNNVSFRLSNVLTQESFAGIEDVDVIFCRNMLIYMSDEAIEKIALNFYNAISDEGFLILGASESLLQKTDLFIPEYRDGVIIYRKNPSLGGLGRLSAARD